MGRDDIENEENAAEQRVQKSEELARSLLENSRDLAYKLDLSTGLFDYITPSSKDVLGYTPEEMLKLGFDALIARVHPDDKHLFGMRRKEEMVASVDTALTGIVEYRW